jgi:hypothetical protein
VGNTALVLPVTGTYDAEYIVGPVESTGSFNSFQLIKGAGGTNYVNIPGSVSYTTASGSQLSGQAIFTANANDYVELANNTLYPLTLYGSATPLVGNTATGNSSTAVVPSVTSGSVLIHGGSTIFVAVQTLSGTNYIGYAVTDTAGNTYTAASTIATYKDGFNLYTQTRIYYNTNMITSNETVTVTASPLPGNPGASWAVEVVEIIGSPYTTVAGGTTGTSIGANTPFSLSVTAAQVPGLLLESVAYPSQTLSANPPASIVVTSTGAISSTYGSVIQGPLTLGSNTITASMVSGGEMAATIIAIQSLPYVNVPSNASLSIIQLH